MTNFPEKYQISIIKDKTGVVLSDHKNKKLLVSNDIELSVTDDKKLCAKFPNSKQTNKSSLFEKKSATDSPTIIFNPPNFNYCVKKDNVYQLSGSNISFNGTDKGDTLILNGVENSKINMGDGNDTILYREKRILDNYINLGDGDNTFAPSYNKKAGRALINNTISSGKGQDYIHLRNSIGNSVNTGDGKDLVEIEGTLQAQVLNNSINTGNDNDEVNIHGDFSSIQNNEFYLGKGSDSFNASVNPNNDAKTSSDYLNKYLEYSETVSNNKIYATEGSKGFFEKNTFKSSTYSANQFSEQISVKALSEGFQNYSTKLAPKEQPLTLTENAPVNRQQKLTKEDYAKKYIIGSMGSMLFNDSKMQEAAFKALDDYVKSMETD